MVANGILKNGKTDLDSEAAEPEETEPAHLDFPGEFPAYRCVSYQETLFYNDQIRRSAHCDRLKRIVEPSSGEMEEAGYWDTSGEQENTVMPGLQHKYPQTALILATNQCYAHCRFCFRKRLLGNHSTEIATDYCAIAQYIGSHPEVNNVLLSGGDPLVLRTDQLEEIVNHLLPIAHLTAIRFGTRALAYYPPRFRDKHLIAVFRKILCAGKRAVIVAHFDHLDEISEEAELHIKALTQAGVQLFNQAVLLEGVNDDPGILAATFGRLHQLGVYPYYLFQARPVKGATHFQIPLRRGVQIVHALSRRLSGIQKTYRYVMSHTTGKIEILDLGDDGRLYMRYHQNKDSDKIGRLFSRPCPESACWFDDLSSP